MRITWDEKTFYLNKNKNKYKKQNEENKSMLKKQRINKMKEILWQKDWMAKINAETFSEEMVWWKCIENSENDNFLMN